MEPIGNSLEKIVDKSKQVLVIAPDKAAGGDFAATVFSRLAEKGFSVATYYSSIAPRVETDDKGQGKITSNTESVSADLAVAITNAVADSGKGHPITISCNTLSLEDTFVNKTLELLEEKGLRAGVDFHLLTTIDAIKEKYQDEGKEIPVVAGTKVLSETLPKEGIKTLISLNYEDTADLTQEIIWRVKAVKGSDVSTAPKFADLSDPEILKVRVGEYIRQLKEAGISEIILGCTELPIAFKEFASDVSGLTLVDPAEVVAERLEKRVAKLSFQ